MFIGIGVQSASSRRRCETEVSSRSKNFGKSKMRRTPTNRCILVRKNDCLIAPNFTPKGQSNGQHFLPDLYPNRVRS